MLQAGPEPDARQRKMNLVLGKRVCNHGSRKLLGLGACRFDKLKRAVSRNEKTPKDLRMRPRRDDGSHKESVRKRSIIAEFLEEILHTLAEPMPELGQKRKCLDGAILPDMKFRRMRGKVPKKQQRALALVPLPSKSGIKDEPQVDLKLLPPGTFTDYLRLLRQKHPREKLSLKLFLKVACCWMSK